MKLHGVILSVSCLFFSVVATLAAVTSPAKQSPRTANLKTIQQYFDLAKDYEDSAVDYWCKPNVQHYIVVIEV
jgi:hypothetical protein